MWIGVPAGVISRSGMGRPITGCCITTRAKDVDPTLTAIYCPCLPRAADSWSRELGPSCTASARVLIPSRAEVQPGPGETTLYLEVPKDPDGRRTLGRT